MISCHSYKLKIDYLDYAKDYDSGSQNRILAGFIKDWISRKNSRNKFGLIHAIQGVDLNYTGTIVFNNITLDDNIIAIPDNYKDKMSTYTKKDYSV